MIYFLLCLLVSVLATGAVLLYFWTLESTKISSVSIIRSFGAFFSEKNTDYFKNGFILHILGGIFFGLLYILLFRILPIPEEGRYTFMYAIVGMGMGFNHGMLDTLALSVLFPKHHPVEQYKKAGLEIAIFHGLGLIPFGFLMGILYKIFLADA